MRAQHALGRELEGLQRVVVLCIATVLVPRPPVPYRQADRPVVVGLALGGHREHVADEQLGHELLVIVVHLHRSVDPADALLDRRLGLDQHQRQTVDQQYQIGPTLGGPAR